MSRAFINERDVAELLCEWIDEATADRRFMWEGTDDALSVTDVRTQSLASGTERCVTLKLKIDEPVLDDMDDPTGEVQETFATFQIQIYRKD